LRVAIIVFPGSNCDNDAYHIFKNELNLKTDFVWHKESNLSKYDVVFIPGGFSYGDYLRAGAIAKFSPIMNEVKVAADKGKLIMGVCNGFQVLVESNLLPGALITNRDVKFLSRRVNLVVKSNSNLFTSKLEIGDILEMPIAHKQGNYIATDDQISELWDNDQVVFSYQSNVNGSKDAIAGIVNKNRNILGMMPHPERAADNSLGLIDGLKIFNSMIENF
tara:strand:+ start:726 stop:1385 length:660 start_codon:yes stop_codon:yes gene_type:complete